MSPLFQRIGLGVFFALVSAAVCSGQPFTFTDKGLKILNSGVVRVVYPYDLAMAGTDATIEVSYLVDQNGAATGATVTKTSNPDAAAAFLAALDEMVFETAMLEGKPVLSEQQTLRFSIRQLQLSSDLSFITGIKNPAAVVIAAREVDGGLKPAGPMAPALFPSSLGKSDIKQGRAVLEFYIDPAGIVRLPKVLSATDPALGWSAASAVLTWRFAPPMKGGEPAIVKVTGLPIDFKAPAETPSALDTSAGNKSTPKALGSGLTASIQINSATRGSKVKVNGTLTDILPTTVALEVDESGFAIKQYVITLALNILPGGTPRGLGADDSVTNLGRYVIEPGQPLPARINFETDGPQVQGTAVINQRR